MASQESSDFCDVCNITMNYAVNYDLLLREGRTPS